MPKKTPQGQSKGETEIATVCLAYLVKSMPEAATEEDIRVRTLWEGTCGDLSLAEG